MADLSNSTIEELELLISSVSAPEEKTDALTELARKFSKTDSVKSDALINEALALAKQHNYQSGEGVIWSFKGNAERTKGNFSEALECFKKAMECFRSIDDKRKIATTHNNLGIVYTQLSQLSQALEHYNHSLNFWEELNDQSGIARITNNLGTIYQSVGDREKAQEFYKKALAINEKLNNLDMINRNNMNLGVVCRDLNQLEDALMYFKKGLEISEQLNDVPAMILGYGNIGVVLEDMKKFDSGLSFALKALDLSRKTGDNDMVAFNCSTAGNCYAGLGNFDEAQKYLTESLETAREINSLQWQHTALKSFITFYEDRSLWKEALQHYRLADEVKEKMNKDEVQNKIASMEFQKKLDTEEAQRIATEKILHNILPQSIADRIKNGEEKIIQRFENASVLFADVVGFTIWSRNRNVNEVAEILNTLFNLFDELATEFGVEKIKTIGDAYMCVAGLPEPCEDHAERMAKLALRMNEGIQKKYPGGEIKLRIGIHSGEVIAGVLGKNKYAYDLWGDTVNTASRMESHGIENKIQVSEEFKNLVRDKFNFEKRGEIEIKGKGKMKTWFLI